MQIRIFVQVFEIFALFFFMACITSVNLEMQLEVAKYLCDEVLLLEYLYLAKYLQLEVG